MTTQTYWLEPTETVAVGLRRYTTGSTGFDCAGGFHDALTFTGEESARFEEDGSRRHLALPNPKDLDDPRWPTECQHGCGYLFTDDDPKQAWQELLYTRADTGERYTVHPGSHDAPPGVGPVDAGATWDAWWYPDDWRGADGIALAVRCPGGPHNEWGVDRPATGGGRWTRTGDPRKAEVTASPSISIQEPGSPHHYHGFLQAGVLTDHIG